MNYVKALSGHPLNGDEGLLHGEYDREIFKVAVCWMATPEAIEFAGLKAAELLIGHEALYFPYPFPDTSRPEGWEAWPVNKTRRELLDDHELSFVRIHGSADEICIFDDFADMLELGDPVYAKGLLKVYEIEPVRLSVLSEKVKGSVGMTALRVCTASDPDPIVQRVGLPWGGLGLFVNVHYQQSLVELDCDVFIAGESDNYGLRFAQEAGIPMIETSHEVSENPGLRHFTRMLQDAFPNIQFFFFENPCCWEMR